MFLTDAPKLEAIAVAAEFLERHRTEGPAAHFFGDLVGEAFIWSTSATSPELAAYVAAGLDRLGRVPLHLSARRRIFWQMWECLTEADRNAFKAKVLNRKAVCE
ncbi:hypothetical protein shim_37380 [Shimia sp. SK013]|uniref:hypothetical protein n=1 Tax=Shimia sp. SK013 TaxID=1389006 RepID=UPI0006B4F4B7|nr:hypothetical protein [Shimia sp. SK013]KPA20072.1 hypothetical protein shim_37380 [Shimia sp. SK013]